MNTEWKLVPVEPVDEQQLAGAQAIRMDTTPLNKMFTANRVYRDMIAAAPPAPTSHPIPTCATGEDERSDDPLTIRFTPVSDGLPDLVEYSPSYAGQWSSKWCAVITARGNIESSRLILSGSQKDALEEGHFYGVWRSGMDPSRVIAWAYMDDIRSAAEAAAIAQQSQRKDA